MGGMVGIEPTICGSFYSDTAKGTSEGSPASAGWAIIPHERGRVGERKEASPEPLPHLPSVNAYGHVVGSVPVLCGYRLHFRYSTLTRSLCQPFSLPGLSVVSHRIYNSPNNQEK